MRSGCLRAGRQSSLDLCQLIGRSPVPSDLSLAAFVTAHVGLRDQGGPLNLGQTYGRRLNRLNPKVGLEERRRGLGVIGSVGLVGSLTRAPAANWYLSGNVELGQLSIGGFKRLFVS